MPVVYILQSLKDKRTYVGCTDNLARRLSEHNRGKVKSTTYRRPLKVIYKENFESIIVAERRERYLKTRSGRREMKRILNKIL